MRAAALLILEEFFMKNNKRLALIIVLVVLVVTMVVIYGATRPDTAAGQKAFTLEVVHSDGNTKTIECTTDLEFVGEALQADGVIEGEEGAYGLYIHVVDGERAVYEEDGAYWAFYLGEEYATQGIDLTPIEDGAVYKLVYTIG